MARRRVPKDYEKVFNELDGQNDRATILVGAAFVEYALEESILSKLRQPQNETEDKIIFGGHGILGDFYEKTWAACFLKIIGPITRRDLELIRLIRNDAAHDMNPISFASHDEIANRCREIEISKESIPAKKEPPDLRLMYIVACRFYGANLILRSGDAEIAEAASALAPYLDR